MPAPDTLVFDLDTPRRPSLDDVDPTLVDEAPFPHEGEPYANQLNQWARLCAAFGRISPVAILEVDFDGSGHPYIVTLIALSEVLVASDLPTPTDNGPGDTTVLWPADAFPVAICSADPHMVSDGSWLVPIPIAVANGVRVKTRNSAGTLTDGRFKVHLY